MRSIVRQKRNRDREGEGREKDGRKLRVADKMGRDDDRGVEGSKSDAIYQKRR